MFLSSGHHVMPLGQHLGAVQGAVQGTAFRGCVHCAVLCTVRSDFQVLFARNATTGGGAVRKYNFDFDLEPLGFMFVWKSAPAEDLRP